MFGLFTRRPQAKAHPFAEGLRKYFEAPSKKTGLGIIIGLRKEWDLIASQDGETSPRKGFVCKGPINGTSPV